MESLFGKPVALQIFEDLKKRSQTLKVVPKLVVLLVGQDPASATYVAAKTKKSQELGFAGETLHFPESVTESDLIFQVRRLNDDPSVHGILIQLPLPSKIHRDRVLWAVDPLKDVDGLHPENLGRLFAGRPRLVPCTPSGVISMLKYYGHTISGRRVVVVGRSEIVGKPMAALLLQENATVTICHSRTVDLAHETSRAEIVVVAMGKPRALGAGYFGRGSIVVDVGIHRQDGKLVGDVDKDSVKGVCAALSPVPGGVGPLTIAHLMKNLVIAAELQTTGRP